MSKQYYNLEADDGTQIKVLVYKSTQYIPYERHLTISKNGMKKIKKLMEIKGVCRWWCAAPTPHHPEAILDY